MKTIFNKNFIALACSFAVLGFSSCKEQTLTPGSLIPPIDNIHTFGLEASFFEPSLKVSTFDSVITSDYTNYIGGVGMLENDPFFGLVSEGMFVQFRPPSTFYSFPAGLVLDSAVVVLPYSSSYGDTSSSVMLGFDLFKITDNFEKVSDFFSFQSLSYNNTSIGSKTTLLGTINGAMPILGDTGKAPALNITLNSALASTIFNADNSKFISPGAFASYLNGFYIETSFFSATRKTILYFKLIGKNIESSARLAFYTHDSKDSTIVVNFPYDAYISPFFTKIFKDYSGSPSSTFLNSIQNRDSVLIQGFPGFFTEITLNNIDKIPPSIINKAQLILTSLPAGDESIFTPPLRINLEIKNDNGEFVQIADLISSFDGKPNIDGLSFIDGRSKSITINGVAHTQYKLNFPRELQNAMMAGKSSITLRVRAGSSQLGVSRFLGDGFNGNSQTKLQTNIIYTKK